MMKQIPLFKVYMSNDLSIVNDTLRSGFITQGNQVDCGGNDRYIALCRKHHNNFCKEKDSLTIPLSQAV